MLVYKCDHCDEEIEGDPVRVVRTSLPDPEFRAEKYPESYSHFEWCPKCAENLPGPKPYKIAYWNKLTGVFSHVVTGVETYSVEGKNRHEAQ